MSRRRTLVVHGRLLMRELRLRAARERSHGVQVMTFEQLAARLAGGFARPVDGDSLRDAVRHALSTTPLGELERIKSLPGMTDAAARTLQKAWLAGIELPERAARHPRLASMAALEAAVLRQLPAATMRPADLVAAAIRHIDHAPALFGAVDVVGMTELDPCWRPLLRALSSRVTTRWIAGPRSVPAWVKQEGVAIDTSPARAPKVGVVSAATAYHEAIEALRWARALLASGAAQPADIAIAATMPAEYDDHFLALRSDSDIGLHFVHGVKITATRDGQAAAALADILLRGIARERMRRLARLLANGSGPFGKLPADWWRVLPNDAPLASIDAWNRLLDRLTAADWPDANDQTATLRTIVAHLAKGLDEAAAIGEALLDGRALAIWRKALLAGPAAALDATLDALKQDDGLDACVSVAWMPASALAAAPRRFVRLLGLNSSRWPRAAREDRLLPDHIIPTAELEPLPIGAADRRDFDTILRTTEREVVLSRARRDGEGRLLGRSPLLPKDSAETYVGRNDVPRHAMGEADRLLARPSEFAALPQAAGAKAAWRDWTGSGITPHDGLVGPNHPLVAAMLERTQSASSLACLLRNPLGYLWRYGLGLDAPETVADSLALDPAAMGELVHRILERALRTLQAGNGARPPTPARIAKAIADAAGQTKDDWEAERTVPPAVIWERKLDEAKELALIALTNANAALPGSRCYGEVPFGKAVPKNEGPFPWDIDAGIEIPETGFHVRGYIDRLDIAPDGRTAIVRDYKTGSAPRKAFTLNGGRELQRCLYALAAKTLLGEKVEVVASLLYLRDDADFKLEDPAAALTQLSAYLADTRASLAGGLCLIGPDTGGDFDDFAFALPANARAAYCPRKLAESTMRLGNAARVWDAP